MSFMHGEIVSAKPPKIFWPLLGLGIVLAADGATVLILHTTMQLINGSANSSSASFYLAAPVAALLVGIPMWFHFIVTPRCATIRRGLLVGVVGSIIAHPVMWMLFLIPALFMPQAELSLTFLPLDIFYSLIFGGWATTPIGALTGVLLIYLQRTLTRAQQQRFSQNAEAIHSREMRTGSGAEDVRS